MTKISPSDIALEGFRITRENPKATLIWAGVSFLVSVLSAVITIHLGEAAHAALAVLSGKEPPSGTALLQALETLTPLLVLGFGIQCVMAAAVYRIVLRHADHGFGYLKLGPDEARLAALTVIYFVMWILLLMAVTLGAGAIMGLASVMGQLVSVLVGLAAFVYALGLLVFVAVRLSLAPAITFAEKRLAIFDSWRMTRGHFWSLLGAYLLAIACMVVVTLLALILFWAAAAVATGGDLAAIGQMGTPDESSIGAYFTPLTIAYLAFASVLTAVYYAVMAAPAAVAYEALAGRTGDGPPAAPDA